MQKWYIVTGLALVSAVLLLFLVYAWPTTTLSVDNMRIMSPADPTLREMIEISKTLLKQRNDISEQLNLKQQLLGQTLCEHFKKKQIATSETGGWCKNASIETAGQHRTDRPLATALAEFFKAKRVASFGDGPGRYKQLLLETGKVTTYDAYDGAPFCDTTSEGRVKFLDLTLSQFGLPLYDWVMSLEVAEHIPAKYEHIYLDNIVRHAREGVVISWAVPGQGGYSHVNNRPFEYILKIFDSFGFSHDEEESKSLRKAAALPWLKKNTNVFRRREFYEIDKDSQFFT